jgi:hypothetical protein
MKLKEEKLRENIKGVQSVPAAFFSFPKIKTFVKFALAKRLICSLKNP